MSSQASGEKRIVVDAIRMRQPMGEFFLCVLDSRDLRQVSFVDMREIRRDLDDYIGIQRKLNQKRVSEIAQFVNTIDATFPTSVVLAVPEKCADYDEGDKTLTLKENLDTSDGLPAYRFHEMAKVLDGQHRIEGLAKFPKDNKFDVPVTIIVNADIADQAYIFATVNLAQTKVNRSLVYDLLDYANSRSPQKTCHEVVVALNRHESGPFYRMIKRLGSATPGVQGETLTQATVVGSLLPMITRDEVLDRDRLLRGKSLDRVTDEQLRLTPFRNLFIDQRDSDIAKNVTEFFRSVASKWPNDWTSRERGNILPRTNGFRAFMRLFKSVYIELSLVRREGEVFPQSQYDEFVSRIQIGEGQFTSEIYPPGTSGEKQLADTLIEQASLGGR